MDYRRLKGIKIDVLLNWLQLRKAASTETPVWAEMSRPSEGKEGWVVIPVASGSSINLGRFSIQKPKKVSRFEFIAAMEVDGAYVSVFRTFLKTKVILRTVISSFCDLAHIQGTQVGDIVALFVEEPVDPMGERCLAISFLPGEFHEGVFGSADIWKIFEHSVSASADDERIIIDALVKRYCGRAFEPIRFYSPAHKKIRKRRAPWIWKEWEEQHKDD